MGRGVNGAQLMSRARARLGEKRRDLSARTYILSSLLLPRRRRRRQEQRLLEKLVLSTSYYHINYVIVIYERVSARRALVLLARAIGKVAYTLSLYTREREREERRAAA